MIGVRVSVGAEAIQAEWNGADMHRPEKKRDPERISRGVEREAQARLQLAKQIVAEQEANKYRPLFVEQGGIAGVARTLRKQHLLFGGQGKFAFPGTSRVSLFKPKARYSEPVAEVTAPTPSELVAAALRLSTLSREEVRAACESDDRVVQMAAREMVALWGEVT